MLKKILVILLAITVCVAGYTFVNRFNVEKKMDTIEIVAEWKAAGHYGFQDVANDTNTQFEEIVANLKNLGVTSIAIHEKTLNGLVEEGSLNVYYLRGIINDYYSLGKASPIITKIVEQYETTVPSNYWDNYMVMITRNPDVESFLLSSLGERIEGGEYSTSEADGVYAIVSSKRISLNTGLGFMDSEFEYVKSLGFQNVIARVQNYEKVNEQKIKKVISQLKKYGIKTVVFSGVEVLGYEDDENNNDNKFLDLAAEEFKKAGITIGLIEVPAEQSIEKIEKGITKFSKTLGYQETKLFSPDTKNTEKIVYEQCTRAIMDRRARIIYLKPINLSDNDAEKNLEETYKLIEKLKNRCEHLGFKLGRADRMEPYSPTHKEKLAIFIGIITGGVLLLVLVFDIKMYVSLMLLGIGTVCSTAISFSTFFYNLFGGILVKAMALLSAIIFALLAGYFIIMRYKKISEQQNNSINVWKTILSGIITLIGTVGISCIGGLFIATLLGDSEYMLKLKVFSGVKVAFALPLILFVIMYTKLVGIYSTDAKSHISLRAQFKKLLNTSITVKYGLICLVIFGAFAFLLLRTGNNSTGMMLPFEENIRVFLEQNLMARPRTKDLLTLPFLAILAYVAIKGYKGIGFITMLIGVLGSVNVINSFAHIRMTLDTTLMSIFYSVVFGIIVGSLAIVGWYFLDKYLDNKKSEKKRTIKQN